METSTQTCYISYTDRYANPEAFLDFPTGVYYEWQGVVDSPELKPDGGRYNTQIAVRLFTRKFGAVINYRIVSSSSTDTVTAADLIGSVIKTGSTSLRYTVAKSGDVIILPSYSCYIYAVAVKDGMLTSPLVVSKEYKIYASKYLFLVPSFNGDYHGRVVRIQLDIRGKKRPRPARFLEFSDYETTLGMGPYSNQVYVVDMATVNPDLMGFASAFSAFGKVAFLNETYLVPAKDDPTYFVPTWRFVLEAQYTPHPKRVAPIPPPRIYQDAEYLYLAPLFNGKTYPSVILRVLSMTFNTTKPIIQQLDLSTVRPDLRGFTSCFTDDVKYAYFVPQQNQAGLAGKFMRLDLDDFSPTGVTVFDLSALNPSFVGFTGGFKYENYAYLVPFQRPLQGDEKTTTLREFPVTNSGLVVRVDLTTFATAESLDLATIHPQLTGFSGAVRVTHYAYFVPFMRDKSPSSIEVNVYSGLLARVDMRDFKSVEYLNLTSVHPHLRGFVRGFAYKQYVILVPHRWAFYDPAEYVHSGKVARIDTTNFSLDGVTFLDLAAASRSQVPDMPDKDLRGFYGGAVSGKYGFFVPYFNGGRFSGKVCRINLDKFDEVQTLDLTQLDANLRGFVGGVLSKVQEPLDTDLFGEFQIRPGTTTPYEYVY
ncbi:hypothetical protein Poli38472_002348 [Pythium oligandrum]|uniref:Uncharacterized protein n=1 Tax=Pythium oligandrum TaxID=41045 RepID=A0A8K1FL25_PYTOL|nr:hypothetical protein Poli38472_002348 [Pythium oligandrum]|eukprot:TMW63407.1 hypothetical protein Poli38472_002348 [Pythium oligandrum]